jgi:hypothetical protein
MKITSVILSNTTQIVARKEVLLHRPGFLFALLRLRHRLIGYVKKLGLLS